MITNLFSTFDPATSIKISINWIRSITCLILIPIRFWLLPNSTEILLINIINKLHREFKILIGVYSKGITLIIISLFIIILINNIIGLLPYVFTRSRHITFTLTLALPIWLTLIVFGWTNQTNNIFSHLIPTGTPAILIPFIVIIETTRNIIRPGSLAVRLTANIIAGHLLIRLLGNNLNKLNLIRPIILILQIRLIIFEIAVALIQSYVFSVLITLYSREVI